MFSFLIALNAGFAVYLAANGSPMSAIFNAFVCGFCLATKLVEEA